MIFKLGSKRTIVATRIEYLEITNVSLRVYTNASVYFIDGEIDVLEHIKEYLEYLVKGDIDDYELDDKHVRSISVTVDKKH